MKPDDEYKGIAPFYDLLLNPFLDSIRKDICRLLLSQKVAHAVDLGCGTGRQCQFLRRHGIKASGVDRSPSMLEMARRRTGKDIEYHQEDLTAMSFRDNTFDAAIVSLTLHEHEPDVQNKIISEAFRISRFQGFVAFLDHGRIDSLSERIIYYLSFLPERLAGKKHFQNYLLFMKNQGLQGLLGSLPDLHILRERRYLLGGLCLCLARKTH
jgi:ubiquinone/menaquinone biosynthesis C-methylase UbiE